MAYEHWIETAAAVATGSAAWVWKHLTGRIAKLEDKVVGQRAFQEHVEEENEKFNALFLKQDKLSDKVSDVHAAVSRVEGIVSRMNGNSPH